MKRFVLHIACIAAISASCGDIDVARQALSDGMWRSALAAADAAATNAAERSEARLVSLEALANLEDDAEIRRRLSRWSDETAEGFRYWRARSLVRVGDFRQAAEVLSAPFADESLKLPVACLKASVLLASGASAKAVELFSGLDVQAKGAVGEDARMMLAEALCGSGKGGDAKKMLDALASSSGRREIKVRAGLLLGFMEMDDSGSFTSGVARVRSLLRANPGLHVVKRATRSFADRLLSSGDASGAADEYRRYLEAYPEGAMDASLLEHRGQALFLIGKRAEAAGAFSRAERLADEPGEKSRMAYMQAEVLLADGRFADAAAGFERSASYGGENAPRALFAEADARERGGDDGRAAGIYGSLSSKGGVWGEKARLRLISISARSGRLGEAIEGYSKVIESPGKLTDDDITQAYLGRGRACYRDYRFKEASADFGVVAKRSPELADRIRFLMALCLYGAGRDIDAKAAASSLMAATKDAELRADLMLWCAKYEFNHGEFEEARSHFTTYASLRGNTPEAADALLWAARCSSSLMEYSKAVELATQAANAASQGGQLYSDALLVQGEAIMELGRYPEAAQIFDRVAGLAGEGPVAVKAAMLKADALYAMGAGDKVRYEEAIAAYSALHADANLSMDRKIEAAFKIGRALEKLRRTREAMDQYYRNVVLAYSAETAKGVLFGSPAETFFVRAAFSLADYLAAAGDVRASVKMLERIAKSGAPAAKEAQRRLESMKAGGDAE